MRNVLNILLLLGLWGFSRTLAAAPPVFDVSNWDFVKQGPRIIAGEWMFYWQRTFTDEEMRAQSFLREPHTRVQAPGGLWRQMPPPVQNFGWATYIIQIKGLNARHEPLAMEMSQFMGTHQTWLYWPESDHLMLMGSSGVNSKDDAHFIPQFKRQVADVPIEPKGDAWLIITVSSFLLDGSLPASPSLLDAGLQRLEQRRHEWEIFLLIGMFGMLMLTNLSLFILRRTDRPSLLMVGVASLILLRFGATEGLAFEVYATPNRLYSQFYTYTLAASMSFIYCVYFEFLFSSFPGFISRRGVNAAWVCVLLVHVCGFALSKEWMAMTFVLWGILAPLGIWMFGGLIQAYRRGLKSSLFAMLGSGVFIVATFFDALIYLNVVSFRYLGHFGMLGFVFMQSLVVAYNFALAFRTAERLSRNLQQEVEQQTLRLRQQKEKLEEQKGELVQAHDSLREADAQKTRFFRSMSHELRTPLTLILGSLPSGRTPADPQALDVVRRNASRLFRLVNQLLDFQKLALSQTRLRLDEIDLMRFLQGVVPYFESACRQQNIQFSLRAAVDQNLRILVMGQVDALEKIIFNYLANALKFTPKGGHISLEVTQIQDRVRVTVSDDGPGIPIDEQDKLFKLFSQIEGPHQREKHGTGLGLALVKELVEHMNGAVGVRSEEGQGAAFWAEFPLLSAQEYVDLLILDADLEAWDGILSRLRDQGWRGRMKQAHDAAEAEAFFAKHAINVFVCRAALAVESFTLLPIAYHTRGCWTVLIGTPEDLRPLHLSGDEAWFQPPIGADFYAVLREKLLAAREVEVQPKTWQLAVPEFEQRVDDQLGMLTDKPDRAKATILVVDDVNDMRIMISGILQAQDFHVLHAANGLQALAMLQSKKVPIDVIVTDWLMPELNGPDMIARLHEMEDLASIPTILLTAKTDTESKAYGTKVGASAYIGKPFDEMELLSTVDNLLDLKKRERRIEELNHFIATHVLQRFLPPDLVEDLVAGKARFEDAAQLRTVTVLFADLCGFTQWTERLGPERIARILNAFLVSMTDVIFSQGGTIDKFMGDGILVIFGAPRTMEPAQQAAAAARCAALMHAELEVLNQTWQDAEGMTFQMRIGIHHGPAVVGSFGGDRRSDYTAVGNTVNVASRVETCAKPGETLVTPIMLGFLPPDDWESAGAFKLKGIEGTMELFRRRIRNPAKQGAA